ncbi:hypothetical protein N7450_004915 [Penicillium hetheringtonii]|uniref:Uncharacterized protein n=1 Tax=Penicillium hetheringtonii TaxID=911720 RepID=A0AAD6DQY1_9EURO|nr:hypothetical protein N7450_004915 [Penicillium hetheringtonii]
MAPFLTLAYVYEKTGNMTYLPWLDGWAEWALYDLPRTKYGGFQHITYVEDNEQELWDDTLMTTLLNRPQYIEEAKRQCLLHIEYLFDTKTGLFFHGWKFSTAESGPAGHNFANALWARGNSWCTIVIPEILELLELEPNDPIRASATAGFAYGILKAVLRRYIDSQYRVVGEKAIQYVLHNVDETGELQQTSYGTPMGHDLQFYKNTPLTPMPYGQAMAIMALGEYLWTYF